MNKVLGLVLIVFAVGFYGTLAMVSISEQTTPDIKENGNNFIITLEERLEISDNTGTEKYEFPLLGNIVYNEDETVCWEITRFDTTYYYKLLEECEQNG